MNNTQQNRALVFKGSELVDKSKLTLIEPSKNRKQLAQQATDNMNKYVIYGKFWSLSKSEKIREELQSKPKVKNTDPLKRLVGRAMFLVTDDSDLYNIALSVRE